MSLPYIAADIIDEARDLRRQGHSLESLATRIGISPDALATLLGEPTKPAASHDNAESEFDLWACDRLADVL